MNIQFYPDELNYVNATLHVHAPPCGEFLRTFLRACLLADAENYPWLRPALLKFMDKYPPHPERLRMEEYDNGMEKPGCTCPGDVLPIRATCPVHGDRTKI